MKNHKKIRAIGILGHVKINSLITEFGSGACKIIQRAFPE